MPPKQSRKSAAPPQAPVTYLDSLFPAWENAKRGGRDKPDAGMPSLQYLYVQTHRGPCDLQSCRRCWRGVIERSFTGAATEADDPANLACLPSALAAHVDAWRRPGELAALAQAPLVSLEEGGVLCGALAPGHPAAAWLACDLEAVLALVRPACKVMLQEPQLIFAHPIKGDACGAARSAPALAEAPSCGSWSTCRSQSAVRPLLPAVRS